MAVTTEDLWTGFRPQLLGYVRARSRSLDDAEDILQEVFAKVHQKLDTLREEQHLISWLYKVTHNTIVDFYRKKQPIPTDLELVDAAEDDMPVAEQRLAPFLTSLVEGLPDIYRQAIALTELEGITQAELARRTGLSISGAKSRVQRGRAMLRQELLACCQVDLDCQGHVVDYRSRSTIPWQSDCACSPTHNPAD